MKKTCFKLPLIGFVLISFTNLYANNIPIATPGFSINLTGLYLQPNADNLIYAIYTHPLPVPAPNWSQVTLKPGYAPSFDLGLQYNFADLMNSANLDWLHVNTSDSNSFAAQGVNSSVAPPYYFGPLAQAFTGSAANSTSKFEVDNVNLTVSHIINLNGNIQLNPFAGLQYAYLKQDTTSNYVGVDNLARPYSITSLNISKFSGIGPRLGLNAIYFVTKRIGIAAKIGGSLLVGTINSQTNFNSFGAGNTTPAFTTLANQDQHKIVPEADTKLEASYTIPFKSEGSSLTFVAGYMITVYVNGINQVVPTALVPGAFNGGTIAIETASQEQSNLSLNGPYASVIWKI